MKLAAGLTDVTKHLAHNYGPLPQAEGPIEL